MELRRPTRGATSQNPVLRPTTKNTSVLQQGLKKAAQGKGLHEKPSTKANRLRKKSPSDEESSEDEVPEIPKENAETEVLEVTEIKKRRGRPKKLPAKTHNVQKEIKEKGVSRKQIPRDDEESESAVHIQKEVKKRVKPQKQLPNDEDQVESETQNSKEIKKRNRPQKFDEEDHETEAHEEAKKGEMLQSTRKQLPREDEESVSATQVHQKEIRKRGRPRKQLPRDEDKNKSEPQKKKEVNKGNMPQKVDREGLETDAHGVAKKGEIPQNSRKLVLNDEPSETAFKTLNTGVKGQNLPGNQRPNNEQLDINPKTQKQQRSEKKGTTPKSQTITTDTLCDTPAKSFNVHWRNVTKLFDCLMDPGLDAEESTVTILTLHSISQWSALHGLTNDELKVLWTLVSDKRSPINEEQRIAFIKVLIPTEKWHEVTIRTILKWLFKESENVSVNIVNAVLEMIYGWNVYGLVDLMLFSNPVTFNRFLALCKERVEILPWLSVVIRKISTLKLITKGHVNLLYDISRNRINDDITNCATELIHYFQYLRPDLFPDNPPYLKWSRRSFDNEQLTLSTPLKLALYEGKKRATREPAPMEPTESSEDVIKRQSIFTMDKINQKFFDEFAPHTQVDVDISSLYLLNRSEAMLIMLRKEETIPLLACDKEALEFFNIWASMVFFHRFQKPDEDEKYIFVLDRCLRLSTFLNSSLPAVTQWLITFLPLWDGKLLEKQIRELLRFMPLHIMSEKCGSFIAKMKFDFGRGPTLARFYIWDILDSIILRWPVIIKGSLNGEYISDSDHVDLDDEKIKAAVENFFIEILSLLRKYAAAGGHKDPLVLRNICVSFEKMMQLYSEEIIPVKPPVPEELAQMGILCDEIDVLELCAKLYEMITTLIKQNKYSNAHCVGFKREMFMFFALKEDCVPLMSLFTTEYEVVNKKELLFGEVEEGTIDIQGIMQKLTCFYSHALREFRTDPTQPFPIDFDSNVFRWKDLKRRAPCLYRYIGVHCPQKNRKSRASEMEQ